MKVTLRSWFPLFWSGATAVAVFPFVFLNKKQISNMPSNELDSLIAHEKFHVKRQLKFFILPWFFLYIFSKKFRLTEEVKAYLHQRKYSKETWGLTISLESIARSLSSKIYFNMATYDEAMKALKANEK